MSTNKIIFTSKKYPRLERIDNGCEFYKELQKFIESGFVDDKGLYKIEDDVFEDIQLTETKKTSKFTIYKV